MARPLEDVAVGYLVLLSLRVGGIGQNLDTPGSPKSLALYGPHFLGSGKAGQLGRSILPGLATLFADLKQRPLKTTQASYPACILGRSRYLQ